VNRLRIHFRAGPYNRTLVYIKNEMLPENPISTKNKFDAKITDSLHCKPFSMHTPPTISPFFSSQIIIFLPLPHYVEK